MRGVAGMTHVVAAKMRTVPVSVKKKLGTPEKVVDREKKQA